MQGQVANRQETVHRAEQPTAFALVLGQRVAHLGLEVPPGRHVSGHRRDGRSLTRLPNFTSILQ